MFTPLSEPLPGRRKRQGGWRMQQNKAKVIVAAKRSHVVEAHLRDWGTGYSSAVRIWRHMQAMLQDDFRSPAVERLASIGTRGTSKGRQSTNKTRAQTKTDPNT